MIKIKDNSVRFYDEDGYELTHPDDIKDWEKRNRQLSKEQSLKKGKEVNYKLSRWAQEVIKILKEHGEMKFQYGDSSHQVKYFDHGKEVSKDTSNKVYLKRKRKPDNLGRENTRLTRSISVGKVAAANALLSMDGSR